MRVLVVNAGSSSVKMRVVGSGDQVEAARDLGPPGEDLGDELRRFLHEAGDFDATGHRVVHGGEHFVKPLLINEASAEALGHLRDLAPLHNPPALSALAAVRQTMPDLPAVACFDTAFHATLPAEASSYALPQDWTRQWGLRRFGFHGLSCEWSTARAAELLGMTGRLVICHLGSGASVTAVADGQSIDTTMGFTPVEGLVMGTRSGDVDPGLMAFLAEHGVSPSDLTEGLERRSGLLALSGFTGDMRALLEQRDAGDPACTLAVAVYLHRLRAKVASMAAALEGVDALVFTGGVGENSPAIRAEACAGLMWLGVAIDGSANRSVSTADCDISSPESAVRTLVIHAHEELVIARSCRTVLS